MNINYYRQIKKVFILLITNADQPVGQKSKPVFKLRGKPIQTALCGPK